MPDASHQIGSNSPGRIKEWRPDARHRPPPHQALEKSERTRCGLRLPKSKTRGVGAFPVGIRVPFAGAREAGNPPCPPVHALVLQAMGSTHYGIKIAANQAGAADTDQRHRQRRCLDAHPRVAHLRQRPPIQRVHARAQNGAPSASGARIFDPPAPQRLCRSRTAGATASSG